MKLSIILLTLAILSCHPTLQLVLYITLSASLYLRNTQYIYDSTSTMANATNANGKRPAQDEGDTSQKKFR